MSSWNLCHLSIGQTTKRHYPRHKGRRWYLQESGPIQPAMKSHPHCLHIEFEYNKSKYHLKDVIVGKIYFLLVRIKIKHMEIAIIKRETTGIGQNTFNENETVTKYEGKVPDAQMLNGNFLVSSWSFQVGQIKRATAELSQRVLQTLSRLTNRHNSHSHLCPGLLSTAFKALKAASKHLLFLIKLSVKIPPR